MIRKMNKMRRSQRKVQKQLENAGFLVYFKPHTRWDKDIWNLFDGIAIKDGITYYLQVSSNQFHKMKPYEEFNAKYKVPILLFNVIDRKGIKEKKLI